MGVYLSEPATDKNVSKGSNQYLRYCCVEMQGSQLVIVGWRKNMQDAAIHQVDLGDGNSLFGVFDGHGGPQVSQYVKLQFTKLLINLKEYKQGSYTKALHEAFRRMDDLIDSSQGAKQLENIRNKSKDKTQSFGEAGKICDSAGCTANVVLITPKKIIVANAGDSRSVLRRLNKTVQLSTDHKPQSEEQQKRITAAGGTISFGRVNGGLNLTRSFGDFNYKRKGDLSYDKQMITCYPDIKQFDRQNTDQFIIMGCDGIWEKYVNDSNGLVEIIQKDLQSKENNQEEVMKNLLDKLLAKGTQEGIGCDNMTAILIQFK